MRSTIAGPIPTRGWSASPQTWPRWSPARPTRARTRRPRSTGSAGSPTLPPARRRRALRRDARPNAMARLLLLLRTTTYRTQAFVDAATKLGVDLVCASERPSTLEASAPGNLVTLDFADPAGAAETVARFAGR